MKAAIDLGLRGPGPAEISRKPVLKPGPTKMLELLYEALASDYGVEVTTNSPERLRQQLYALRKKADDPALDVLSFVVPAQPETLWIVKRHGQS